MKKNKLYLFIILACFVGYGWLFFSIQHQHQIQNNEFTVCLLKKATNIPCPSCGTTRAVIEISKGKIISSIFINPFGILVALIMLICPIWIGYDFLFKKDSFYQFYKKSEAFLRKRKIAIAFIVLVLLNWIWNINKNV
jgi:hypothetical protein